jgi:glycosyltransferase involved in cell wall biosynthesis
VTLRVLSLATLFPRPDRPGFGRFVARQFKALADRGDIELVVISPIARPLRGGDASLDRSRGYPVHYLPFAGMPFLGARWNPALIARAVLPLARQLHAEARFDLVDAQFFYPDGPAAARVARALSLPLTIKARGSDIHFWGKRSFALRQMLAAAKQAQGLLAVSAALRTDMAALGMDPEKITVHYTGLEHDLFHPRERSAARSALGLPVTVPLLAGVGNLVPLKGHGLAIAALAELPDVHLVIAGSGPELKRLKALAAKLGLAGRVHLPGAIEPGEIAQLLCAADAMVLPSEREGLANVWIETLACGTPLVISDVGGAREVVTSPRAGRLVERNPGAIAAAVRDILANPPSQTEVAAHAARFSWEANAAQLAEHYRLVAG